MSPSRLSTYPGTGYYNECNWVTFGRYLSNIWYSHLYKILFVVFSGKNHTQTKRALRDEQLQGIMPKTSGQGWFYDIWLKCKVLNRLTKSSAVEARQNGNWYKKVSSHKMLISMCKLFPFERSVEVFYSIFISYYSFLFPPVTAW